MGELPIWAYAVAAVIWGLILLKRSRARKAARVPNVLEGYHRPLKRQGF